MSFTLYILIVTLTLGHVSEFCSTAELERELEQLFETMREKREGMESELLDREETIIELPASMGVSVMGEEDEERKRGEHKPHPDHHEGESHGPHHEGEQHHWGDEGGGHHGGGLYEAREDIFIEKRWQPVYAEERADRATVINGLTDAQKQIIIDQHNKVRRQEGSSNMESLHYNEKLAVLGQQWCQRCRFEHGQPPFNPADFGSDSLGQNIYAHTDPKMEVDWAVKAWYDEKPDFDYNTLKCTPGKICGHYTAVTWATTTDVGCGLCFCPSISGLTNAKFIVCNYVPPGNWAGQKPFKKGPQCTQCDRGKFYCNNGLCEKTCTSNSANCVCKADCKQCGKKTNDCGCQCPSGTQGADCSDSCQDLDPQCNKNPGLPPFLCTISDPNWAFVKDKCPMMCKKCVAGNPPSCKRRQNSRKSNSIKRLMLDYLEKELDKEEEEREEDDEEKKLKN